MSDARGSIMMCDVNAIKYTSSLQALEVVFVLNLLLSKRGSVTVSVSPVRMHGDGLFAIVAALTPLVAARPRGRRSLFNHVA